MFRCARMLRRWVPALICSVVMAAEADAEEADPKPASTAHHHGGFYARVGAGAGAFGDSITVDGEPDRTASGVTVAYEGAIGATPFGGLVVGGALWGGWIPNPTVEVEAPAEEFEIDALLLHTFGVHADYYFRPNGGFHAEALLGYALLTGVEGNAGTPHGIGFGIGGGYEWWLGEDVCAGVLGRVTYAPLGTSEGDIEHTHVVTLPALLATLTYH